MSLQPQTPPPIPPDTARIARAAFPKGNPSMQMRDFFGTLYLDTDFADLFPPVGQPAAAPWRLILVLIMQFAENLTDRQAADAVRGRLDWKYALSLELDDPGFDFSVLSEFRARLVTGKATARVLELLLTQFKQHGLLTARGKQRTDSTHILGAICALNRLELVGRTLQHALEALAKHAPTWLRAQLSSVWFERYRVPLSEYRLPKGTAERTALAETIGRDGKTLLEQLRQPGAPSGLRDLPALIALQQIWDQQYTHRDGQLRWRETAEQPPANERIVSPIDPEARWSTKRSVDWRGYKVQLTETCDDDGPHLITNVLTTLAGMHDSDALPDIHQTLKKRDLLPAMHLVDTAYASAETLTESQTTYGVDLVCPIPPNSSWQAQDPEAYDATHFQIDWAAQQVTCPEGHQTRYWKPVRTASGRPAIQVRFHREDCRACPVRARCTRSQVGRELILHEEAEQRALEAGRQRQESSDFKATYARRAGIEGTIAESVQGRAMRQTRYLGLEKTALQHVLTVSAINIHRAINWMNDVPRATTRRSHFAALAA